MNEYLFFLSYARRDAKGNRWVRDFYRKLSAEVARLAGLETDAEETDAGFFDDEDILTGDEWPDALADALQKSRSLVCLYSRNYFKREDCGKEFEVFRQRVRDYERTLAPDAERPRLILPVLWDRPGLLPSPLPDAVSGLQFKDAAFGELYSQKGLEYIIRMDEKKDYERFIINFAERLDREISAHKLPPLTTRPSYLETKSAFHTTSATPPPAAPQILPQTATVPNVVGLEATWFVYVTGRKSDYQGIRRQLDSYGNLDSREWRPYLPPLDKMVGVIAPSVASENNMLQDTLYLSKEFVKHLQEAEKKNTPVIIIVDPWSIKANPYKEIMDEYDGVRLVNCGVIVVWNEEDEETREKRQQLFDDIAATFSRSMDAMDTSFRASVRNEEELRAEVRAAIAEAQERIKKRAQRLRPEPPGDDTPFPIL